MPKLKQNKTTTQRFLSTAPLNSTTRNLICADSGANKTLVRQSDAVAADLIVQQTSSPLSVQFPDGVIAQSTGVTEIILPATNVTVPAHVFPDEKLNQSLFSIVDITDNGYDVTFKKDGVVIQYQGAPIYFQEKLPTDLFWQLPLSPVQTESQMPVACIANSTVALPSDHDFVAFMHAAFGSPCVSTFLRALRRNWLDTIPRLTATLVSANRPNSIATALGHLDQKRQGIDSTRVTRSSSPVDSSPQSSPSLNPDFDQTDPLDPHDPDGVDPYDPAQPPPLFCKLLTTADIDASGRFPVPSSRRNEYMLLSYFKGYVHVEPLPSRHDTAYIDAYTRTHDYWTQFGPVPDIVRLDNETSAKLEAYIKTFATFQYFPPGNHRANRAERVMRTWKNHFIATLATASPKFPLTQWDRLIQHAEITLNCLLPWHPDPSISAYHGLTGAKFDFRAHPIGPAGTAVVIHDKPDNRGTWQAHGTHGYYLGPALQHYRTHRCLATHTGLERLSDTVAWFPEFLHPPTVTSPQERLQAAIFDLKRYINRYLKSDDTLPLVHSLVTDIEDLALMYNPAPPTIAEEQRVSTLQSPLESTSSSSSPSSTSDPAVINIHRPNEPLSSVSAPTAPTAPSRPPYRTRSTTASERMANNTAPTYQALEYTTLLDADTNSLIVPTFSDDQLEGYINAWLYTFPRTSAWASEISHLSPANHHITVTTSTSTPANSAQETALNLNQDGTPLTYRTAKSGPNRDHWQDAEDTEVSRLLDSQTMYPRHPQDQPLDRRKDTTYYNPQTKEKLKDNAKVYRIRGTIGGDRINYTGITKANTAAMPVVKMLLQSVVSDVAEFMTIDIKDFYLNTQLPRSEWMRLPVKFLSESILNKYNLQQYIHNGAVLFEVVKSLYGLPHAGKISQDSLITHLAKHGYHQTSTTCLFRHESNGVTFTLVVDDFGVKFTNKNAAQHLIDCLTLRYPLTVNWNATKYLGLTLRFDKINRLVGLSIPGYIQKLLQRFPPSTANGANSPAIYVPPTYGSKVQAPLVDSSPPLSAPEIKEIQAICGALLYYCIAVDPTGYPAVTSLASEQSHATLNTRLAANRLLSYFHKYPDNELILKACNMRLHQQADGSYLSRTGSRSVAGGISYLGNDDPTEINGAIHVMSTIIPTIMSSVGETEYVACFLTGQHGAGFRQVLADLGYPQPATYILTDNECAEGIANNTIKPKRTKSIEMQYHWIRDRVARKQFIVAWRPGAHNLADFFTKALSVKDHQKFLPLLVQTPLQGSNKVVRFS